MSLDINNEDTERLARPSAATTGESVTVALHEPLLVKGDYFSRTDVVSALDRPGQ